MVILDDTNAVFTDWKDKVRYARQCGMPLRNVLFLVVDQHMPLAAEKEFLVGRQEKRHAAFWDKVDRGVPGLHASDGKVVPAFKIEQMISRLRKSYFDDAGRLRRFTTPELAQVLDGGGRRRRTRRRRRARTRKYIYTALFLTRAAKEQVLAFSEREFGTLLSRVVPDLHCTLVFGRRAALDPQERACLGRSYAVTVTGRTVPGERVQALVVGHDCPLPCANATPHITIATGEGVPPVESNKVLAQRGQHPVTKSIVLDARMGVAATVAGKFNVLYAV